MYCASTEAFPPPPLHVGGCTLLSYQASVLPRHTHRARCVPPFKHHAQHPMLACMRWCMTQTWQLQLQAQPPHAAGRAHSAHRMAKSIPAAICHRRAPDCPRMPCSGPPSSKCMRTEPPCMRGEPLCTALARTLRRPHACIECGMWRAHMKGHHAQHAGAHSD